MKLRVLISQELQEMKDGTYQYTWVCIGLEHWIAVQGKSVSAAKRRFRRLFADAVAHRLLSGVKPAARCIQDRYAQLKALGSNRCWEVEAP